MLRQTILLNENNRGGLFYMQQLAMCRTLSPSFIEQQILSDVKLCVISFLALSFHDEIEKKVSITSFVPHFLISSVIS